MTFFKTTKYFFATLLLVVLVSISDNAYADGMGYSVQAIIPENQIDKSKTYFDLQMTPGQIQNIELEIKSSSNETLNLSVVPYVGTTNQNGELEYSVEPKKNDSTLLYPITNLLSGKQTVTLKPKETKRVTFRLKMPDKAFHGKIVGGFNISDKADEEAAVDSKTKKNDVQIKNVFSIVLGIQLREKIEEIKPELKLNVVKANLFNYRTAITANIQNTKPEFIGGLSITAKIRKNGSKEVLYQTEKSDMAMAPNSNFDFPISLENQELVSGNYELELNAHSKKDDWQFTKKFRITEDDALELNEEAVELEEKSTSKWVIIISIIVGMVILLSLLVNIILWKKR